MQNSVLTTRINSLYGSKTSPAFCGCKTVGLAPELLVSMGPSPHLWFCAFKTANLAPELQVPMGPRPRLWICACKVPCLPPDLQVSTGP